MTSASTLAIDEEPFTFEILCADDLALAVATLGWLIGREQWGLA